MQVPVKNFLKKFTFEKIYLELRQLELSLGFILDNNNHTMKKIFPKKLNP